MKIKRYTTGPIQVNTYLVYDENNKKGFIVDPGGYSNNLTKDVFEQSIDIQYIILTHGHGDHIGGVEEHLKDFPNAKVVAYREEQEMLENPNINCSIELFGKPITIIPDLYVDDNDTLSVGEMQLHFLFTPGHTKGGMSIYVDKYIFSGDTLFRFSIGRTDFYGGDFETLIKSIKERIFTFPDDTVVLPGHMGTTTVGEEKRGNPFV